uniref:Uncharacterized protein n=1 Tax=Caulobacter sp. (strain K31) TaxID=366602 RepID=B0T9L1_CAUSK
MAKSTGRALLNEILDRRTLRDLQTQKPQDTEKMSELGVSKVDLDAFVRPDVNEAFPPDTPPGQRPKLLYRRGELKSSTTYKDLCAKCRV